MRRYAAGGARAMQTTPEEITICLTCPLSRCQPAAAFCPLQQTLAARARKEKQLAYSRKRDHRRAARHA